MDKQTEPTDENPSSSSPFERLIEAALAYFPLHLFPLSIGELKNQNWFNISVSMYYIGIFGLIIWSFLVLFTLMLDHVLQAQGLIEGGKRAFNIGPLVPIGLYVFAGLSKWSIQAHSTAHSDTIERDFADRLKIVSISSLAIPIALFFRQTFALFTILELDSTTLSIYDTISLILLDISWISLLLIGIGGIGSLFATQPNSETD